MSYIKQRVSTSTWKTGRNAVQARLSVRHDCARHAIVLLSSSSSAAGLHEIHWHCLSLGVLYQEVTGEGALSLLVV